MSKNTNFDPESMSRQEYDDPPRFFFFTLYISYLDALFYKIKKGVRRLHNRLTDPKRYKKHTDTLTLLKEAMVIQGEVNDVDPFWEFYYLLDLKDLCGVDRIVNDHVVLKADKYRWARIFLINKKYVDTHVLDVPADNKWSNLLSSISERHDPSSAKTPNRLELAQNLKWYDLVQDLETGDIYRVWSSLPHVLGLERKKLPYRGE